MGPEQWRRCDDVELVIAAVVGNLSAFDELARRYRSAMLTVAQQTVGTREGAEDVVQEALLLAFKALPQLDDANRFGAWVYSITRHRALRHAKREGRMEPTSDMDEVILANTQAVAKDPGAILEEDASHQELRDAMKRLPSEYQVVLQLCYWDEMPQQQIADFLDIPLTTVKWRLHKGKEMLRTQLER